MREGTIPPNWTYLVQHRSQSGAPENIDLNDTWLTPDLDEDTRETPTRVPIVAPENNIDMITLLQTVQQLQESTFRKGASLSEVIKLTVYEGV